MSQLRFLGRSCARLFFLVLPATLCRGDSNYAPSEAPKQLTFAELLHLATDEPLSTEAQAKLNQLLSTPFVSNGATVSGVQPVRPQHDSPGPVMRVAEWNIERGVNEKQIELSLSNSSAFEELAEEANHDDHRLRLLKNELEVLRGADVLILDEVDLGMKRSGYRDVARSLADSLHFNYVYGVEFVELNRLYLGEKKLDVVAQKRSHNTTEVMGVDPSRYLGLEGNALLTRYPIRSARIIRLPECYDWFHGEIREISDLERAKRWSADKIFDERVRRQVRRGGRMALIIDLIVPEAPLQTVTVVAPHFEDYCPPKCRRQQMDFLLSQIGAVRNVVVIAGDLNTNNHDGTPTSIRREVLKRVLSYRFWAKQAFNWFIPIPFAGLVEIPLNYFKNYHDPTALNVHILLPNHEKPLFNDARGFRFADGGFLDFDGERTKSTRHKGHTLAQSNERSWKGFAPTFSFEKTYHHLVGSYKLDWLFVKPAGSPESQPQIRGFVPTYGRTLRAINTSLEDRVSDHCPITVDLPLTESLPMNGNH